MYGKYRKIDSEVNFSSEKCIVQNEFRGQIMIKMVFHMKIGQVLTKL